MTKAFLVDSRGWTPKNYDTVIPLIHGPIEVGEGFTESIARKIAIASVDDVLILNGTTKTNAACLAAWLSVLPSVHCGIFNGFSHNFDCITLDRVADRMSIEAAKDQMERERDER